jgi:hypothetical protein
VIEGFRHKAHANNVAAHRPKSRQRANFSNSGNAA